MTRSAKFEYDIERPWEYNSDYVTIGLQDSAIVLKGALDRPAYFELGHNVLGLYLETDRGRLPSEQTSVFHGDVPKDAEQSFMLEEADKAYITAHSVLIVKNLLNAGRLIRQIGNTAPSLIGRGGLYNQTLLLDKSASYSHLLIEPVKFEPVIGPDSVIKISDTQSTNGTIAHIARDQVMT